MRLYNDFKEYINLDSLQLAAMMTGLKKELKYNAQQAKFWFVGRKNGLYHITPESCRESYKFYADRSKCVLKAITDLEKLVYGIKRNGRRGEIFYDYK